MFYYFMAQPELPYCPFERQTFNELYDRYGIYYILRHYRSFFHTTSLSTIVYWHITNIAEGV